MALLSRNEVCPRSNLSLALAGTTLDPHAELQSLKGLKAGALIRLVEEPYTFHSARVHLARVVELLRASGPHDALREGQSPSVLETLTHTPDSSLPNGKSLKRSLSNSKGESANQDGPPPEYLLPGSSERPLMALLPHSSQSEVDSYQSLYLKDLSLSCWHPPPGHRKLQGDFMYMTVVTIEGRHCDITSCPKGFFLNRSTDDMFDPRPAQSTPVCHCLTDLLCHVSPTFKQAFTTLKNRSVILNTTGFFAFVRTVMQAAETVVDGFVEPVNGNPEDPAFLWSGLFMSQGRRCTKLDIYAHSTIAVRLELKCVQAYSDLEGLQGLHTLPTAIVDYRGVRLSAQGLAPGFENFYCAFGAKSVSSSLLRAAKSLFIQRHVVVAPKGHQVPLFTSLDAQGLLGADGRFYLLDVFRSFPVDANFCPEEETPSQTFPHSLSLILFWTYMTFLPGDSRATDAVRAACRDVGSVSDIIFEMRFNPNVFSPGIRFPPSESASTNLQEKLLREAAAFIITHQIPDFVSLQCCLHSNEAPMDGVSLKQALHQRGINLRYLGHVVKAISQSEHKEQLRHIMVCLISSHLIHTFKTGVDVPSLSAAVSHFLSCLLVHHFTPSPVGEEAKKKSRRRGRGAGASESTPWSMLTGSELWNLVCQDAVETYGVSDSLGSSPNHLVENYGLQKLSLLREFCLKTGVQVIKYSNKAPFSPDDILNIFPVVKHIKMPTADASKAYRAAQTSIQKGLLDQAHEQLKEAAYLYGRVCDDLDPEACNCNSLLAKVTFLQGKAAEARSVQLKTVVISERVLGFDHPNTIQQYALLAVYAYAGGETTLAQKCLLRARLLLLTVHGEDHPYTATLDVSQISLLKSNKEGSTGFAHGSVSLPTCFLAELSCHHLLAQWMCSKGDYRSAMTHEKEALSAFTSLVCSSAILRENVSGLLFFFLPICLH
uniref:Clustered mitochondria protein homolog n=1 Tax=Poecilia latipinna TaxID=48699 RepID=A0A3B3TLI3_9TELE